MGKIDKEKLLKEIKLKSDDVDVTWVCSFIKNFPEEPEIDFDALYREFFNDECDGVVCSTCKYYGSDSSTECFVKFLKSKKLTAPQIDMDQLRNEIYSEIVKSKEPKLLEIPVKRTWTLKPEFERFVTNFGISHVCRTIDVEIDENIKCFYDQHEEPDYSKIAKGSIVVVSSRDDKIKSAEIVDHFDSNYIYCNGGVSYELKYVKIRIVELAKE